MELEDKKKKLYKHCIAVLREPVKMKKGLSNVELQEYRKTLSLDFLTTSDLTGVENELNSFIADRIQYFERGNRGFKVKEYEEIQKKNSQLFGYYIKNRDEYSQY